MVSKVYYTWDNYSEDLKKLKEQLLPGSYDFVIGVARGGLIPAVELSHYLETPMISLFWQTRDGIAPTELPADIEDRIRNKRILIVDDICDSGETLHQIYKTLVASLTYLVTSVDSLCLHYNSGQTVFQPDIWARTINKETDPIWICYPWE